MVNIIYGNAGSGKTNLLIERLENALKQGNTCFYFVPEQYSFSTEKRLCSQIEDKYMHRLEIVGFKQFCDFVFEKEADFQKASPSDASKAIIMSIAVDSVSNELKVFKGKRNDCGFIIELTKLYEKFNEYKIENLEFIGESDITSEKLNDLKLIFTAYSALYDNRKSDLTVCAEIINNCNLFTDCFFYFDAYNGFTPNEYDVVEAIIKNCKEFNVTLHTEAIEDKSGGFGVYSDVISTAMQIKEIARRCGKRLDFVKTENSLCNLVAKDLETELFSGKRHESKECKAIELYCLNNPFSEVTAAATLIKEVTNNGAAYSDVVLVSPSTEQYRSCYEAVFNDYNIPYFDDSRSSVIKKPISRFLLNVLEATFMAPNSSHLLSALKCGILPLSVTDLSLFENYLYMWNVRYYQLAPKYRFKRNPNKVSADISERDEADLKRLNEFKSKFSDPLFRLIEEIAVASPKKKTELLYDYLEENRVADRLKENCLSLRERGFEYLATEEEQLWDILVELFDELHSTLPDKEMDNKLYYYLFKNALSTLSVGKIPHFKESVTVGELGRIRLDEKKHVIFIGATENLLPQNVSESPVLNDIDIAKINEISYSSIPTSAELQQHYRLDLIQVLTKATEKIYILRHKLDFDGKPALPAAAYNEIISIYPDAETVFDTDRFNCTEKKLLDLFGEYLSQNSVENEHFTDIENGNLELIKNKIAISKNVTGSIGKELARELYYNSQSYSSITEFRNCAFSYFCKYGLKLDEKAHFEINSLNKGNFIHYCLENAFKEENFYSLTDDELKSVTKRISEEYVNLNFDAANEQSSRYKYYFENLTMRLYDFLLYARDEGNVSKFRPHDFELDISKTDDITPYKIDVDDGLTVTLKGKIDRVDCYETENDNYIRVVDYKTGKKDFSIKNIVNGLDLQMFIYLFALVKNGKDHFAKELKPAAVMYIKNFLDAAEEDLLKETKEKSITNGLFLNDNSLLSAMDSSCDSLNPSKYIPVSYKKDGSISSKSPVVDAEKFKQLEKYVTDALNSIVCNIYSGNVTVSPLEESDKSKSKCDYCKFESICGRSYKSKRKLKNGDWDVIEKGVFDCNDN